MTFTRNHSSTILKLATYRYHDRTQVGCADDAMQFIYPLLDGSGRPVQSMHDVVSGCIPLSETRVAGERVPIADLTLMAPLPRPARNIFCVGKNYREHAKEFARSGFDSSASRPEDAIPAAPIIFTKAPESVIATGQPIRYPAGVSDQVDYEAELAVVIGTGGRAIGHERAAAHVFGYTIVNDVTARDLQARHKQWFLGKSLDTFCPMGPVLVTADEWTPVGATLECRVNGELRQQAAIADLIFDIATLIATISAGITLYPGDVIATGTPAGVGIGFKPPRFLQRGDIVDIRIPGIGVLSNRVD